MLLGRRVKQVSGSCLKWSSLWGLGGGLSQLRVRFQGPDSRVPHRALHCVWSLLGVSLSSSALLPKKNCSSLHFWKGSIWAAWRSPSLIPTISLGDGRALSPSPPDRSQPSRGWQGILSYQDGDPGAWLWWTEWTQEKGTHPINHKEPNEAQTPGDGPGGDFQAPRLGTFWQTGR